MKKQVKIKCQNGISFTNAVREIFPLLANRYHFIEDEHKPDYILFGPYGNDVPKPGDYVRIGYYCENIKPDLSLCEWAFGVPREEEVNNYHYKRIQWHGLDPTLLVKNKDVATNEPKNEKRKFCNFFYSNKVDYREEFFRQLSKYKNIDSPGNSMNNMSSIDNLYEGTTWERKRFFLEHYKFTIAFENYIYAGYQTEKLYDAMLAKSLPIYLGDPFVTELFNTKSFINASDYINLKSNWLINFLEKCSQQDFYDIRPAFINAPYYRIKRKLKSWGRKFKMQLQLDNLNFSKLIERIIEIDCNDELYDQYIREPWLKDNKIPEDTFNINRWIEIFENKK
ncbi:glycosyltransferase family 10 domain-containing protein [Pedobacter rhodius]|uniref:Glycosyltransferase family 10 n=1 Tax=Pedobacter rhodius TaxID=3004098 RepID=A0ABT4KSN4_9SPHI|nr:glycosyltransferase family 10 [Pedobacter sp. SJ11]MCZ4221800.1 glycosyltransferase family 10 [Pedobacter sp. SJ11]